MHCPGNRGQSGGHTDGRALLGLGSAIYYPQSKISFENCGANTRLLLSRTTCSRPPGVSDWAAFLYEGVLVEFGPTEKLFTKPDRKETEDYITGRFG